MKDKNIKMTGIHFSLRDLPSRRVPKFVPLSSRRKIGSEVKDKLSLSKACRLIRETSNIVVFTGAGISVESGIPDFRSSGGLWERFNPGIYAHYPTFLEEPELFWEMSTEIDKVLENAQPNLAHFALAELEAMGKLSCVITQNIDNLHKVAGNKKVYELHGNASIAHCIKCKKKHTLQQIKQELTQGKTPRCSSCNDLIKTGIILFGEPVPHQVMEDAMEQTQNCQLLIVIGSSLSVSPANLLPSMAKTTGAKVIFINKDKTSMDNLADVVLVGKAGEILPMLIKAVRETVLDT